MKRILLLAAGAPGTAGMIAMAGPASADNTTGVVSKPGQSQLEKFSNSIKPETSLTRACPAPTRANSPMSRPEEMMHDVYLVTSKGSGGGSTTRTVFAASEDDARRTHQENYAGEPIVDVHQR